MTIHVIIDTVTNTIRQRGHYYDECNSDSWGTKVTLKCKDWAYDIWNSHNQIIMMIYTVCFIFGISLLPYGTYIKSSTEHIRYKFTFPTILNYQS